VKCGKEIEDDRIPLNLETEAMWQRSMNHRRKNEWYSNFNKTMDIIDHNLPARNVSQSRVTIGSKKTWNKTFTKDQGLERREKKGAATRANNVLGDLELKQKK